MSIFLVGTCLLLVLGCGESNPVSTGFSTEGGYSINLGATQSALPYGGKMAVTAIIKDSSGNPVQASLYPVTFTSEAGGEFAPMQATIASGVVTTVYVAPKIALGSIRSQVDPPKVIDTLPTPSAPASTLPQVETITMSFQGAFAKLRITLFKP
jgi:hypothetical protein